MKQVAGHLKLTLAQFRDVEAFLQFGSDLDPVTKKLIERGLVLTKILNQDQFSPMPVEDQILIIFVAMSGVLDGQENNVKLYERFFIQYMRKLYPSFIETIKINKSVSPFVGRGILLGSVQFLNWFINNKF
jgi:F-type H+-transporting ATPase subunit alpha